MNDDSVAHLSEQPEYAYYEGKYVVDLNEGTWKPRRGAGQRDRYQRQSDTHQHSILIV